jgi:predicted ATPase/class 3 adenylate cyclase
MDCGSCGRANASGARFCNGCGAALPARAADDAERKTVSVVFTDVVGSTALGERLDPESLRAVMARYFDTMRSTLEAHGATVEKFIGDAVMAVFGVPVVREDDALRAVRATLDMREALERLNAELDREHGVRLLTRTGINTGEVVVGGAGSARDQRLATGDAVNVAARLQQAAAPGETYIGEQTHAAVRNAAVLEALPPLQAKGKSEPLRAWRLVSVQHDAPAIARSTDTPFVGRRHERDQLQQVFDAARRERACRLVTIVGTPGTGKSRLTREFLQSIDDQARVLVGRCAAYGQGITYLPLAEVVRAVAGDDPELALALRLRDTERGDVAARVIVGALGGKGQAGSPEETAWAFRRLFEALAASQPLALVIDDIHWAESPLLDLIEYLVGFSSGAPILVLCLTRPDLLETRPSWSAPHPRSTLLALQPLTHDDASRLIDGLRPDRPLAPDVRQRIVDNAEGNPLFVEQMLAMLAEQPDGAADAIPPTIHALLAARLDRLPPAERAVLQRAAVQGRLFQRSAVAELLGPTAAGGLGATLLALARKEFVRPDASSVAGDDAFLFNHALIRDVAYASLTKESRAQLHANLAVWLEQRHAGLDARDEIVGHHLEQAVRYRRELGRADDTTTELGRRAGELLAAAGRRVLDRGEGAVAASLLERAAHLLEGDAAQRAGLLCELASAQSLSGALDAAALSAAQAITEAQRAGDAINEQRAQLARVRVGSMRTRFAPELLRGVAERAIAVFEAHDSEADLADAWLLLGFAESVAGDGSAQLQALRRAREHAIASGDQRRQIDAWNEVGGAMIFGRTPVSETLVFLDEELAWARERGLAAVEADALLGGPYLYSRLGRFDEARERLERSKALARELGLRYGLAEAHTAGAQMEMLADDPAAAERELRAAIDVVAGMGATRYVSLYRMRLVHVLIALERDDDAWAELENLRERMGDISGWKMAHARLLARAQRSAEAVVIAREAAAALASSDDLTSRAAMMTHLAEVLSANGDTGGAVQALTEALKLHEEKGNLLPAQRCREQLAAMGALSA